MYSEAQIAEMYPGMYDVGCQETDDILHDYYEMLEYFGGEDETVVKYRDELIKRGVEIVG